MATPLPTVPGGISLNVPTAQSLTVSGAGDGTPFWGDDGFTFDDLVDVVNPLQHIPWVSGAYRAITGDQIAPGAMGLGGGLFGGLAGFTLGIAQGMIEGSTGKSIGANLAAMFQQDPGPVDSPENTAVAMAVPEPPHPSPTPVAVQNQPPVLSPEQMAVLLASVAAPPQTGQNLAAPATEMGELVAGGIGGLVATGNINPMFLPLVPMAGVIPGATPNDRQDHEDIAPLVDEAIGESRGAERVSQEIRALFGLK
jgi:hypothetical protein